MLDYVENQQKSRKFLFEIKGTLRVLDKNNITNNNQMISVSEYIKQFFNKCSVLIRRNDAINIEFYVFDSIPKITDQIVDEIKKLDEIRIIPSDLNTQNENVMVDSDYYIWVLPPVVSFEQRIVIKTAAYDPPKHDYPGMTTFANMSNCKWNLELQNVSK